jgi:hypothetical protein
MEPTVTTARAAEIVSIGYEGLRSYLKRGLLGSGGLMAPFVHRDAPAPDLSRARAKWTRFGVVDLCLIRLAKQLIDLGLSFRAYSHPRGLPGATLMTWPPHYDFIVFAGDDLRHLPNRLGEAGDVAVLVQLDRIADHVRAAMDGDEPGEA